MYSLNDQFNVYYDRVSMRDDLSALRALAEEQALKGDNTAPGPFEMTVELDSHELVRTMDDVLEAQERSAAAVEEQNFLLLRQTEDLQANRVIFENLLEIESENLTVTAAVALASVAGVHYLDYIADALDDSNEWLEDINDGIWTVNETLERIEEDLFELCDDVCHEIRVTGRTVAKFLAKRLSLTTHEMIISQQELAQAQERSAVQRHQELIAAIRSPLHNEAEEKYNQALIQYRTRHFGLCARELREVFRRDSTHVLAWVLYGQLCSRRGLPALARSAFQRAASYALETRNDQGYLVAILSLSRLERLVGNQKLAVKILGEALFKVTPKSMVQARLQFERLKLQSPSLPKVVTANVIVVGYLDPLFKRLPELRDEVAKSRVWAGLRDQVWYLRLGNAPYLALARRWFELQNDISRRILVFPDMEALEPLEYAVLVPCRFDAYQLALEVIDGGRLSHPQEVADHLRWLEDLTSHIDHPCAYGVNGLDDEFIAGHEHMVMYVAKELCRHGRNQEAYELVRYTDRIWNRPGHYKMMHVSYAAATDEI